MKTKEEKRLLQATKTDKTAWIGLADLYEDQGRTEDAVKARCSAGLSTMIFYVYDPDLAVIVKRYKRLCDATNYVNGRLKKRKWSSIPAKKQLIIKVFEARLNLIKEIVLNNENS